MSETSVTRAETLLGHAFADRALLAQALTHRSAAQGRRRARGERSNERLEFLGDRVLGLLIAEWLVERFPNEQEGELGPRLAHLVSRETLAQIGVAHGFPALLSLGPSESSTGVAQLGNVVADALEAALGALFLDAGLEAARTFVRRAWHDAIEAHPDPPKDAKTALQEYLLARGLDLPRYELVSSEGPSHAPIFVVTAMGAGQSGTGSAGTKRAAQRLAAADLLAKLT